MVILLGAVAGLVPLLAQNQPPAPAMAARTLPSKPFQIDTAEHPRVTVTPIKGLANPWSLAFLPDGTMLVTERPGRLRMVRKGVVDPTPISGVPAVYTESLGGLMEVALHPRFAETRLVYLTYSKAVGKERTAALSRGRLEGMALVDVKELFVSNGVGTGPAPGSAMAFGRDGMLYMAVGGANDEIAQNPESHTGKIIRLRDDGTVPPDNPFVGRAGHRPEIYSIGHRNMLGLTVHPTTGEMWENENGPLGGDEVNILKKGGNYGWPLVSYGRQYSGARVSKEVTGAGLEDPVLIWNPSIAISGMTFYTGDRFPRWKNNLFVGGLQFGRIPGTGQMHRIVFNEQWEEIRREAFFVDLRQRIRNVRQGPDGLLYVLTDESDGAILRLEPQ
jgi:glucose/arabinose dehydrogenase